MGHPAMDLSGRVAVVIGGTSGIGRTLAIEWGPKGVNVNAIAPGVFRFGQVEECVGATVFLASEAASFINGEIIAVDGGFLASGVNQ